MSRDGDADAGAGTPPARLLVVEDEPMLCELFARYLQGEGFEVRPAAGGEEAVGLLAADPTGFRLALIDVRLRGEDGRDVAARLRQLAPGLPVLFMSGADVASLRPQAPEAGGDTYLQKPFALAELREQIRRALGSPRSPEARG